MGEFNDTINTINKSKEAVEKASIDSDETAKDDIKEPINVLYKNISECVINILQDENVNKQFVEISKSLSSESTKALIELLAVIMTHSSYQSILTYDNLLKEEITKQFDNIIDFANNQSASIDAIRSSCELLSKRIAVLQEKNTSENI